MIGKTQKKRKKNYVKWSHLNPPQMFALSFIALIIIGTLLLKLPFATVNGTSLSFIDALFEATSAVCVTGLVVVDTGTTFTVFGQIVIMLLIQMGGLGFMTFGVLIALLFGKNIGLQSRLMIQESFNQNRLEGMVRLVKFIFIFTIIMETIGAFILTLSWLNEFGFWKASFYGLFHSISAFNNAGFDLIGNYQSLTAYNGNFPIIMTISGLIIIGGLGFTVVLDIWKRRLWKKYSLQTKLVILLTIFFIVLGTMAIYFMEFDNEKTLGNLSPGEKWLAAFFHSVVPRTAGFNSLSTSDLTLSSQLLTVIFMFIGGGSGGTAGGIKLTTFAIILFSLITIIRGNNNVHVMKRMIQRDLIYRAYAITVFSFFVVSTVLFVLTITEKAPLNVLLFEVVSAFGTVGMSLGYTSELTAVGKILIALLMFAGRVGPLTLAFALTKKKEKETFHYSEETIMIG
ncbi:TrkH family potassium uptake protein [Bacillus kwashiorkori]|uniref:TrkH family potassium uptake protein n=1 Tax=Bacillus kwashiorkori TaxID=1522318 RepID=UPI0008F7E764|nr:TrkH family potassium uptake protein [Bacillus kwashiorkori]